MYTKFHEYAWREAKDKLEFEIGKAEGQLRNCRNRMDLAKREMKICIMTFIIGLLFFGALEIFHFRESGLMYLVSAAIASWMLYIIYLFVMPFLTYSMVKAIMFYILCRKKSIKKESLKEHTGFDDIPDPEKTYAIEEEKLIRILSNYYAHRNYLDELNDKIKEGELTMTVEEMQEKIDQLIYYQEIVPASPYKGELVNEAKIWGVIFSSIILIIMVMLLVNSNTSHLIT